VYKPKIRKIIAAVRRIQKMGKISPKALPIATAIPVVNRKASMAPTKTEKALNREHNVITAICVLSPNSAITTSANDARSGVKLMSREGYKQTF